MSSSTLNELERVSSKHSCSLPHMVCAFVLWQLASLPHRSELRTRAQSMVGGEFRRCMEALALEGIASSEEVPGSECTPSLPIHPEPTPLDSLCSAWREQSGEHLGDRALKRLSAQVCSKYGTLSVRNANLAAQMFRTLFPEGTFFSFANDAHRYAATMDSASVVWRKFGGTPAARERWMSAWATAKTLCAGDYAADDPYLFVPAANPKFDMENFARLVGTVDLRDAMALASCPSQKKRPPSPEYLTGIGGLK